MSRARFAGSKDAAPVVLRALLTRALQINTTDKPHPVLVAGMPDGAPGPVAFAASARAALAGAVVVALERRITPEGETIGVAVVAAVGGPAILSPGDPLAYLSPAALAVPA